MSEKKELLSFDRIRAGGKSDYGQFRASSVHFGWKPRNFDGSSRKVEQHDLNEISNAEWMRISQKESQLKFRMKDSNFLQFEGFKENDYESVAEHFKRNGVPFKRIRLSTNGWHWGTYKMDKDNFLFDVDGQRSLDIYIPNVHSINSPAKNDISIEFPEDDEEVIQTKKDILLGIRFTLPPGRDEEDPTKALRDMLLEKSGAHGASQNCVCTLSDVRVLVPSARFDISLMKKSLKLRGKSNDFVISYDAINKMFLVPVPNTPSMTFVLSLDTPLRKGNTRHGNVVMQLDEKKWLELELNLRENELKQYQQANPNIEQIMSGYEHNLIVELFKALIGKSIIIPEDFKSSANLPCFRCSNRAQSGFLYPLSKMLLFSPKPVIIIKYDDILSVEFGRTSGSQTRLFEFRLNVKGGAEIEFNSVDRQEYHPFQEFIQKLGLRVRTLAQENTVEQLSYLDENLGSDSSDQDFNVESESDESGSASDESDASDTVEGEKEKSTPALSGKGERSSPKKK